MNSLGERLKYVRTKNKMTQDGFSVKTGVSRSNISRIEKDDISPSAAAVVQICDAMNLSAEWLLTGRHAMYRRCGENTGESELLENYKKLEDRERARILERTLTLVELKEERVARAGRQGRVEAALYEPGSDFEGGAEYVEMRVYDISASAGFGNYLYEGESTFEMRTFPAGEVPGKADFGIRISGDSMEPRIQDKDIVWVKEQIAVDNEEIGIFILENEAYCKKLVIDHAKHTVHLVSLNKKYLPVKVKKHHEMRTIGKVLFLK